LVRESGVIDGDPRRAVTIFSKNKLSPLSEAQLTQLEILATDDEAHRIMIIFAAVHWSRLAQSGQSLHCINLSAFGSRLNRSTQHLRNPHQMLA
jgi:hypothetical protein